MFLLLRLFLVTILFLGSGQAIVFAGKEPDKDKEVPPWMEKVDQGGRASYLVPKGAKTERIGGGQIIVEPPDEYTARRFFELEKRQADLENELKEIKSELEEIREQCAIRQQSPSEKNP